MRGDAAGALSPRAVRTRWVERALIGAAVALVIWFYGWTVKVNSGFYNWGDMDYYQLLVRGWLKGQLHLDKEPAAELLALADPYDPTQNEHFKLGDASLYRNKYYIYFGPAPALTLMLPWMALTGQPMTMGAAVFVFVSVAFLAAAALWLALRRRFFPASAIWTAPVGVLALGFGTHLLALAQRPMFWELAIASGLAFGLLAAGAAYRALFARRRALWMAGAGLCLGLAVGSRPTWLFALALLPVPLWQAWRETGARSAVRLALAALGPLALCGLALMAHNYARFENPLEWGQNYQLSGAYEGKLRHFSLTYMPQNIATYFFHPLQWTSNFPFALAVHAPECTVPGYFGTEEVSGLAATFPFFWFVLALPLAWRRRDAGDARALARALAVLAAGGVPVMALVLAYFSTTMRYEADFAVTLGIFALLGLLALERRMRETARRWRRALSLAAGATCGVTVAIGTLVSFDYHDRSLRRTGPGYWHALEHRTHRVVAAVGHWLGRIEGPRVVKVRFKQQPAGTIETFWQPADPRAHERVVVQHVGERLIRFGAVRGDGEPAWGRELRWESNHTHTVEVQMPSLYPLAGRGWWSGVRRMHDFRERACIAVWFSGGRALGEVVEPLPPGLKHGGAVSTEFSGEVRKVRSRLFRDDELEPGLPDPHAKRGGVLRLRVVFAASLLPEGEPLFAGGAHYRSTIVFVQPAEGGIRFVFENYASPRIASPIFTPNPAGHDVELVLPNFNPEAFGEEATGDVIVRVDGVEWMRTRQVAYSTHPGDEKIGSNPFGTTCASDFRGWIRDARWVRE